MRKTTIDSNVLILSFRPPGSGKTKTIVAIVGALLSESLKEKGVAIARPTGTDAVSRSSPPATKKLLVCAPSNAAVDELVMRFRLGIKTMSGDESQVSIVRLGRSDAINSNVKDVTLEELVNAKLNLTGGQKKNPKDEVGQLMMAHKATCEEINAHRSMFDEMKAQGKSATADQEHQFELLKRKRQQLSNNIDTARDNGNVAARDTEISRRQTQQRILDEAHIICATLSGSGHDMFQNLNIEFETVIIDEAAQSIELSALIPMKYGCSRCILVGDPKQLPPTVLSREAARFQYEQSLFVRMQTNHPRDVHLLDTQYRMHPEISSFPSSAFYEGRLLDGPGMLSLRAKPWHKSAMLGPYRFFDVQGAHQAAPRGHSLVNFAEIEVALRLFERLTTDCRAYDFKNKIGIITPYKSQLRELKLRFGDKYGRAVLEKVEFNTTDAFQGRESEVIIFSCVRASISKGIGFLDDIRRMNVGITRAKCSLWVLGNSQSLMKGEFWAKLIQDAKSRDRFSGGNLLSMLDKPIPELAAVSSIRDTESSDVEMADDPVNGTSKSSDSRRSSSSPQPRHPSGVPAGGRNGLNVLANCEKCGSAAHMTHQCDNVAAAMTDPVCLRCGGADHVKDNCTIERCVQCGEFGHVRNVCLGRSLTSNARDMMRKEEDKHRRYMQKAPMIRAQRQLGDHDKNVPVVRTTTITPPKEKAARSALQVDGKRKREDSPPMGQSRNYRNGIQPTNGSVPWGSRNAAATSLPRALGGNIPGRPAVSNARLEQTYHPATSSASSPAPEPIPANEKKLGVNRPPLPPHRVLPALKKRKEADPFIRPKDKRPKR